MRDLSDRVFRLCLALLHDEQQARDAAQEAMMRGWQRRTLRRREVAWWTWYGGFAVRVCREARRRRLRDARLSEALATPGASATQAGSGMRHAVELVREAVMHLPPRQREVTVLRYLIGATTEETAEVLGCPQGTVKSNLHKALVSLHAALAAEWSDDDLRAVSEQPDRGPGG